MNVPVKTCPWCGYPVENTDPPKCRKCGWTPGAKVQKKALATYGIFLLVALILTLGTLVWIRRLLHEAEITRPTVNLIVPPPLNYAISAVEM